MLLGSRDAVDRMIANTRRTRRWTGLRDRITELSAKGGGSIGVRHAYSSSDYSFNLYVQGCLFQYAYGHVNLAIGDSVFDGFCALDAFRLLAELSAADCRRFAEEYLRPERMALSVITPKKV